MDRRRQWKRIEKRVTKTTGLYKELNPEGEMEGPARYLTVNTRETDAIRAIFKLRAGTTTSGRQGDKAPI